MLIQSRNKQEVFDGKLKQKQKDNLFLNYYFFSVKWRVEKPNCGFMPPRIRALGTKRLKKNETPSKTPQRTPKCQTLG